MKQLNINAKTEYMLLILPSVLKIVMNQKTELFNKFIQFNFHPDWITIIYLKYMIGIYLNIFIKNSYLSEANWSKILYTIKLWKWDPKKLNNKYLIMPIKSVKG